MEALSFLIMYLGVQPGGAAGGPAGACGSSDTMSWAPMYCWGWNYFGQIGDGTWINRKSFTSVKGLSNRVNSIAVGWAHTCASLKEGTVKCWGANESGQLGDGTNIDKLTLVEVIGH
jgi:alpha-tubulin suppressor-like RCC1 family protein